MAVKSTGWIKKAAAATSIATLLIAGSAFSASVGVGVGVGGVGVGVGATTGNSGVGASAGATAAGASAGVGVGAGTNGVGASAGASTSSGVGATAAVGVSSATGVGVTAGDTGTGVSATNAATAPTAGVGGANSSVSFSSPLGLSVADIQGRLGGPEGRLWRALLKRRCPDILAHFDQYDAELVDLCRFIAIRAAKRPSSEAHIASNRPAIIAKRTLESSQSIAIGASPKN
jgi:hypothetical protein